MYETGHGEVLEDLTSPLEAGYVDVDAQHPDNPSALILDKQSAGAEHLVRLVALSGVVGDVVPLLVLRIHQDTQSKFRDGPSDFPAGQAVFADSHDGVIHVREIVQKYLTVGADGLRDEFHTGDILFNERMHPWAGSFL